jgi:hypothetical protein
MHESMALAIAGVKGKFFTQSRRNNGMHSKLIMHAAWTDRSGHMNIAVCTWLDSYKLVCMYIARIYYATCVVGSR